MDDDLDSDSTDGSSDSTTPDARAPAIAPAAAPRTALIDAEAGVALADAVLLAAALRPGERTAEEVAALLHWGVDEVEAAVEQLRGQGLLQRRQGSPSWGGADRLRPSKDGRAACAARLRQEILGAGAGEES